MAGEFKVFRLTSDQARIVAPLVEKAEAEFKDGHPGIVAFQVYRNNAKGPVFAKGRFIPNHIAVKTQDAISDSI